MQCKQSNPWPARNARVGTGASPVRVETAALGCPSRAKLGSCPCSHNNSGFAPSFPLRNRLALTNLLPPHRVVQPFLVEQLRVPSKFDDAATLQYVDSVG